MTAEDTKNIQKAGDILEHIHVEYLGDGTVKLTHGLDTCVKKLHKFPEYLRHEGD